MTDQDLTKARARAVAGLNREYSGKKLLDHRPRKNRIRRMWVLLLAFIGGLYHLIYGYFSNHWLQGLFAFGVTVSMCCLGIVAVIDFKEEIDSIMDNPWHQLYFTMGLIGVVAGWWVVRYLRNKH